MKNNLLIGGLRETDDEDCHHTVQKFPSDILSIIKVANGICEVCRNGVVTKMVHQGSCWVFHPEDNNYGKCQSTEGKKNNGFNLYAKRQQLKEICKKQNNKQELIQVISTNIKKTLKDKGNLVQDCKKLYVDGEKLANPLIPQN